MLNLITGTLSFICQRYLAGIAVVVITVVTSMPTVAVNTYPLEKGMLLVASRHLIDPTFQQSVILLTQNNHLGSSGIILNRRSGLPLAESFPEIMKILPILEQLYIGGPVARSRVSLLVRSAAHIDGANEIMKNIYHIDTQELFRSMNLDVLNAETTRLFAGYAGWAPGQLEAEMKRGDWHAWAADESLIFSQSPHELWPELIDLASAQWVFRGGTGNLETGRF